MMMTIRLALVATLFAPLFERLVLVEAFSIHRRHPNPRGVTSLLSQVAPLTTGISKSTEVTSVGREVPNISPYAALDHFLSICSERNEKQEGSIQIVSRGSSKLPPHQAIESFVFTTENSCVVAVVADSDGAVDPSKLETALSKKVDAAPMDQVQSICGFSPGTIPPLGHYSPHPVSIVIDQGLLEKCQSENLMLLGGGSHAYWQSLVSPETLLSLPNLQVAPISSEEAPTDGATAKTTAASLFSASSTLDLATPKDFSSLEPPPMHIAQLVSQQRELSNPLTPSLVTMVGRLGKVESKGKRLVTCEFLPLKEGQEDDDSENAWPWKSSNGVNMALQLIAGKMLLQHFGTTQGEAAIQNLKEGLAIQVQAKTNVGNRESLVNWVEKRNLDLLVLDYQLLTNGVPNGEMSSSTKPYKNKPKADSTPFLQSLTLKDIFNGTGSVQVVDNMDGIQAFDQDYAQLLSQLDDSAAMDALSSEKKMSSATLVGIDCEWQPRQFLAAGEPQPVLLMQVSLQALQKVYLFDFQTLLRPLLPQEESMNALETALSDSLSDLFASKNILKTGYQLTSDLRMSAASYPHIPCFQEVQSVLEASTLIKKILHITKQKKSRAITMSLARMTSHYLGKTVDKENQVSDWSARPLTSQQLNYAALDAAISPRLTEKVLESIDARINGDRPLIERWDGDKGLEKEIESWRFSVIQSEDPEAISNPQAKRTVGSSWIVSQSWITGNTPPEIP